MPFRPTDFTQVNHAINEALVVARACACSLPRPTSVVIDWFCGLGNFTLAAGDACRHASLGIEGSAALVERAARGRGARTASRRRRASSSRNLFEIDAGDLASSAALDKWLIDPPREGAFAIVKALVDLLRRR